MSKFLLPSILAFLVACGDKDEDTGSEEAEETAEEVTEENEEGSDTGSAEEQIQFKTRQQPNQHITPPPKPTKESFGSPFFIIHFELASYNTTKQSEL